MSLVELGLRDFRCFEAADLRLADTNLIIGPNGAGKTSLIESIYFLSRARSFRTGRLDSLVREGGARLQVFGAVAAGQRDIRMGVERDRDGLRARFDGAPAESIATLAQALPVLVIEPHSHLLVEGGPASRRRFIDWGTFHVEQQFLGHWRRFRRALSQRNALLKQGAPARLLAAWNDEYVDAATAVDQARRVWLRAFGAELPGTAAKLLPDVAVGTRYRPGWAAAVPLPEALERAIDTDRERGMTTVGPHRADLVLTWDGLPAQERVSRGQQKLLAITMLLAQATVYANEHGERCTLLVDDPAAELDSDRLERLMQMLRDLDVQLVITGTQAEPLRTCVGSPMMFHVEQGALREVV
ncbi:MAG TPA: DNA replication/repair protein RecF [Gammaproteobacteria bacterium]|nr:DNA replication/repair protein RecF [Gammaproteobacteria bacterium]HET7587389.1 DNA replication/repair protein RecF [Gammaproteobacteria bacterium]